MFEWLFDCFFLFVSFRRVTVRQSCVEQCYSWELPPANENEHKLNHIFFHPSCCARGFFPSLLLLLLKSVPKRQIKYILYGTVVAIVPTFIRSFQKPLSCANRSHTPKWNNISHHRTPVLLDHQNEIQVVLITS